MQIWKWALTPENPNIIEVPMYAQFLAVQIQHDMPQIWALVDENQPKKARTIMIYGTGKALPNKPGDYIGTFQTDGGTFVWHVFEYKGKLE
jgi:hypothetical protein